MRIIAYSFIFVVLGFISTRAEAFLFIEPQLGYSTGTFKYIATQGSNFVSVSESLKGPSFGAKGGFEFGFLQLGLDYLQTNATIDGEKDKLTETAAIIGLRFSWFRLYGGAIFSAKEEDTKGTGAKAGLSFYALENLAINLEYRFIDYEPFDYLGFEVNADYGATALMLSVPFSI